MEIVISDSSTLILLSKSKLISIIKSILKIYIPEIVYLEIIRGKEKNHKDAYEIEDMIKNKEIIIINPNQKTVSELEKIYKIDAGELYAIALAKELNKIILIDDKKGINACNYLNIKLYTSLTLLELLFEEEIISKEEAKESLKLLETYGRYSKDKIKNIENKLM
jgi:hypothetical protein